MSGIRGKPVRVKKCIFGKPGRKRPFGRTRNVIKIDLKNKVVEGVYCNHMP
jgi:hypothetical protein